MPRPAKKATGSKVKTGTGSRRARTRTTSDRSGTRRGVCPRSRPPPFRRPRPRLKISVAWQLDVSWRAKALLERVARHVAAAEGHSTGQLSIAVVGSRAMSILHQRYVGKSGPTDVLTFDLGTDRERGVLDAEVVLCADVAARKTTAGPGVSMPAARAELALYLTHGILHLSGYDDHRPSDAKRMHAREDKLLTQLGLGTVFRNGS